MTPENGMKVVYNILAGMDALIQAAMIVTQEHITAAEDTSQAKGIEDVSNGVLGRIQEASAGLVKTFGKRVHPMPGAPADVASAKGSEPTGTDRPTISGKE